MEWHWTGEPLFSCLRDGHNDTNCISDNATAAPLPWRSFSHALSTCVHPFVTFQPIFKCYRLSWAPLCFFVCRSAHVSVKWSRTHRYTSVRKSVWTFLTKKFCVHIVCTYSIKHFEISSFFFRWKNYYTPYVNSQELNTRVSKMVPLNTETRHTDIVDNWLFEYFSHFWEIYTCTKCPVISICYKYIFYILLLHIIFP